MSAPGLITLRSPAGVALIAATVLASMVSFLDANVVNVAIPAIGRDLGAGLAGLQWALTGYLLSVAALLLLSGALADRFGRRRVLEIGLAVMLVASILCALAPSVGTLIAARVVQGAGSALVVPTSLALLNGALRVPDRARGIGIWAAIATIGTTLGPYAGGWFVDHASWRSVFLLNVPLIVAGLIVLRFVPESPEARRALSLDAVGAVLTVVGLGGVIYGLNTASGSGWGSASVWVPVVIGVVALAALVPAERRIRAPMLRLSLFGSRQFDAINVATVLFYGALAAAGYLLVLQCELRLGYSAAAAGAALIPSSVVFLAVSPWSGVLVARLGPRWLMVAGILVAAVSFGWLSFAQPGSSYGAVILPSALLWGLGIGLAVAPLTAAVLAAVPDADLGEASAVNDAASRLGGLFAVAAVPILAGATGGDGLATALGSGYRPAMLVLAGVAVAAALVTALFVSDARPASPVPAVVPPGPHHGCAPPTATATATAAAAAPAGAPSAEAPAEAPSADAPAEAPRDGNPPATDPAVAPASEGSSS
ncbi:DHA2 family efflux MFS transporter permease subunit [Cryptosporangium phraense]|uniref:DHA2 family efflux MFS transporter permease subunit n=1 Tax=Cryptosporangium phraense TaxID=2593070 RepID=A0A545AMF6_9ACTN|nr:DHA2 family efflux MFS transporter permease subunit [Cryptosporangium phraense]TQS41905.1 DHA2 family efflux MFS transporter permease subunit [Cryptosporangium phraense]